MKVFHRTFHSEAILREGFRDAENTDETSQMFKGVWVSADALLDNNGDADGDVILYLEIPDRLFEQYEWVEEDLECRMYREVFIPAAELNRYPIQVWNEEEYRSRIHPQEKPDDPSGLFSGPCSRTQ